MVNQRNHRDDIQGLRGVAVLLVVVFHCGIGVLHGGYIGVDVFFVLSGYLIAGALIRELEISGEIALLDFYARRARRLIPASALVLVVTTLVWYQIYSPLEMKQFSSSVITTATYLSNFWFAHLATDYLADQSSPNPLLHTWSLSVEEQFYMFWPFILIAIYSLAPVGKKRSYLVVGTIITSILSLILCVFLTYKAQPWAFFNSFTRLWEFGAGALCVVCFSKDLKINSYVAKGGASVGLALIIVAAFLFGQRTQFPGYVAVIPVLGASLLLVCVSERQTGIIYRMLANRGLVFVGDISYSLYLWHWPVFVLIREMGKQGEVSWAIFGIIISGLLASATYFLVENPIRFNASLAKSRIGSYGVALSLLLVSLAVGFGVRMDSVSGLEEPKQERLALYKTTLPEIYERDCHLSFSEVAALGCEYGDPNAEEVIVLFGDSHAAHWFPPLKGIAEQQSWRLIVFTKSSCPSVSFEPFASHLGRNYAECTQWRNNVFAEIRKIQPKKVLLSNSYYYMKNEAPSAAHWKTALKTSIGELQREGLELYVMRDTPMLEFDAVVCLSRAVWQGKDAARSCNYNLREATNQSIEEAELAVIRRNPSAHRVDLLDEICATEVCEVQRIDEVIFSDSNHLTVRFANSLQEQLYEQLFKSNNN